MPATATGYAKPRVDPSGPPLLRRADLIFHPYERKWRIGCPFWEVSPDFCRMKWWLDEDLTTGARMAEHLDKVHGLGPVSWKRQEAQDRALRQMEALQREMRAFGGVDQWMRERVAAQAISPKLLDPFMDTDP